MVNSKSLSWNKNDRIIRHGREKVAKYVGG